MNISHINTEITLGEFCGVAFEGHKAE